ncbi:MAG: phospho-N-acetylmuramoyl-pentapeptide-transferase [Oscillospiraceae bacterium]
MKIWVAIGFCAALSFLIAFVSGFVIIPWLRKLKFGQTILDIGPAWHKSKQGTPVMGGFMFIISTLIAFIITVITDKLLGGNILTGDSLIPDSMKIKIFSGLLMALGFGLIGFADDYIKVVKKRNLGLTVFQKTMAQVLIMLAYLGSLYMSGNTYTYIPFVGMVDLKFFFWFFGMAVIYATVNAVNFTDGVDGLCASVTSFASIAFIIAAALRGMFGVSLLAAALAGGCLGYLIWNWNPSKVMMGDTGSMFLGGMVVALAYAIDCPLIILFIGIIYVVEMLSDVIQIGYFKATHGKRIFKMAPIHHHLEMSGWKEKKICVVFSLITILGSIIGIALFYYGIR